MKIFYDGDCYFCKNYVEFAKLQARVGDVVLISLRSDHEDVADVFARGFQVNRGFVIEHNGEWFEGDKAFSYLNLLLDSNSFQAKFLIYVSGRARLSLIFYRLLVFGRFVTLFLQGLALLDTKSDAGFDRYRSVARLTRISALLSVPLLCYSSLRYLFDGNYAAALYSGAVFFSYLGAYFWAIQKDQNIERQLKEFSLGKWKAFTIFLFLFLIIINAGHDGLTRRFLGFLNTAPIWGLFLLYGARAWKKREPRSWIIWLPAVGFLFAAIPGLQLGSFFGGISGWVIRAEKSDPIRVGGYKLVNKNEESHWLAYAIFQPHGQVGRFRRAFLAMPNTGEREFMQFSFETYKRIFPGIERGNFPHQWALGDFAYPTHSLQKYDTKVLAEHFRPKDIVEIINVSEKYNYEGVLIEKKIKHRLKITE